jgi:hypothetical protein
MAAQTSKTVSLNEVQLMLLRLFSRPMNAQDTEAIRHMLLDYYEALLQKEVSRTIEEKGINRTDFDRVLDSQQRTK